MADHGFSLFAQAVFPAPNANSLGIVLSDVLQHQLVKPYPSVPVSSVVGTAGSSSGSVVLNYGLVLELL